MPAPKKTDRSALFNELQCEAAALNDTNDCTVKALSIATGTPYREVHALMERLGRKPGRGAMSYIYWEALRELGYEAQRCDQVDFLERYPSPHREVLRGLTTHHPARFPKAWRDGCTYLMLTRGHILAIVDGVNHDWTVGRAKRCVALYRVTKKVAA